MAISALGILFSYAGTGVLIDKDTCKSTINMLTIFVVNICLPPPPPQKKKKK